MMSISEFFLLGLSLGTLNNWSKNTNQDPVYPLSQSEKNSIFQPETESKSLYDLMAHFPQDEHITCPESDSRFRYPGECSRYITCRDFHAHVRQCPPGMYFDEMYKHCRLAFEVGCEPIRYQLSCDSDEEYSDCGCERTCRDVDNDEMCVNECDRGCFCRSGYVRDDAGNCVEEEACENSIHSVFHRNVEQLQEFA